MLVSVCPPPPFPPTPNPPTRYMYLCPASRGSGRLVVKEGERFGWGTGEDGNKSKDDSPPCLINPEVASLCAFATSHLSAGEATTVHSLSQLPRISFDLDTLCRGHTLKFPALHYHHRGGSGGQSLHRQIVQTNNATKAHAHGRVGPVSVSIHKIPRTDSPATL